MQRYADFRPTGFDAPGAFLPDQGEWLVVPVSRTRDSGPFDESNFAAAVERLGGEGEDVEIHRFGHWGPGWFELILVRPGTDAAAEAERIEEALENYPLLNEEDFSAREWEAYGESWELWGARGFVDHLQREYELRDSTRYFLDDVPTGELREFFERYVRNGEYYVGESDGVSIRFGNFDASREELAGFIREHRG
jgi:hypothetical protein